MKIFYCSRKGIFTALVTGLIHLGKLPFETTPTVQELMESYAAFSPDRILHYLGKDIVENEIFILNFGDNISYGLLTISHFIVDNYSWKFFEVKESMGYRVKIGNFLTEKIKMISLGARIQAWGIEQNYRQLVNLVGMVKEVIGT